MKKTEQDKQNKTSDQLQQVQPEEGTDTTMEQISDTYKEGTIEDTDRRCFVETAALEKPRFFMAKIKN